MYTNFMGTWTNFFQWLEASGHTAKLNTHQFDANGVTDSRRKSTQIIQAASDKADGLHGRRQYTKTCIDMQVLV